MIGLQFECLVYFDWSVIRVPGALCFFLQFEYQAHHDVYWVIKNGLRLVQITLKICDILNIGYDCSMACVMVNITVKPSKVIRPWDWAKQST